MVHSFENSVSFIGNLIQLQSKIRAHFTKFTTLFISNPYGMQICVEKIVYSFKTNNHLNSTWSFTDHITHIQVKMFNVSTILSRIKRFNACFYVSFYTLCVFFSLLLFLFTSVRFTSYISSGIITLKKYPPLNDEQTAKYLQLYHIWIANWWNAVEMANANVFTL